MMPDISANKLIYDIYDPCYWEYVMMDLTAPVKRVLINDNVDENNENAEINENLLDQVLEMPTPWFPTLNIDRDKFANLYPRGFKLTIYKKTKVEQFAPYNQPDGLIRRIKIFQDYERTMPINIISYYKHRIDNLILRRRFPFEHKIIEFFAPGRSEKDKNYHPKQII